MIQRFIELGAGYSDIYELVETIKYNHTRVERLLVLHSKEGTKSVSSLVVVMKMTDPGRFQALYICREGIPDPRVIKNKRYDLFAQASNDFSLPITELEVQPSTRFAEIELFYSYLIGILRMNRYIKPLS